MKITDFFKGKKAKLSEFDPIIVQSLTAEASYRKLAFMAAVNLIASAVCKCEIKTLYRGVEKREDEYWILNVNPNLNQNASEFWRQLIFRLYSNNEALIVPSNGQLFVADSFMVDEYALQPFIFSNILINGTSIGRTFAMNDVLYWRFGDDSIKAVLDMMYTSYGTLLQYSMDTHKRARGRRGVLTVDAQMSGRPDFKEKYDKIVNRDMEQFMRAETAVLPLFEGFKYDEQQIQRTSAEAQTTRDIRAQIDDIFDFTSMAFSIPSALLKGEKLETESLFENFLTFCIDPLCALLEEELIKKRIGSSRFKDGWSVRFDTSMLRHVDILKSAANIEKLIGSGTMSVNDILMLLGREKINADWADKHYMTKNIQRLEDGVNSVSEENGNAQ